MDKDPGTVEDKLPPLIEKLLFRLTSEESLELEYKAAQGGLPKGIWETISAFANTKGGWIVLGMEVRDRALQVDGVRNASGLVKLFFDLMRNPQKISYPICGAEEVYVESIEGKDIIIIRVPAAQRKVRPVYIIQNPYTGTYLRRHEGDYRATKPEVDRMMREASDVGADSAIVKRFGLDDIDRGALARYRRRHQTQHPDSPWSAYDDLQFLRALNGYRRDRETGEEGLTVAGLLMFGTVEAIREWRTRHLIDYRALQSHTAGDSTWDDRVEWEGNLFGAYEMLSPRLVRDQPVPFAMQGEIRVAEGPVHMVLREALVNLLVHADYTETQSSLIQCTPEGYSFRNPGSSRVPESDLLTGDRSDPRNPELVRMFRLVGLAEEAGTGIPRILKTWRRLGFRMPRIDVGTERYEFQLELRHAHLLSDDDRRWLSTLGSHWSEAEQLALVCARHEDGIDNLRLRQLTGLHPTDATKVLSALRNKNLLAMVRGGRGAYYRLGPKVLGEQTDSRDEEIRTGTLRASEADTIGLWSSVAEGERQIISGVSTSGKAPSTGDNAPNTSGKAPSTGDSQPNAPNYEPELVTLSARAHERQRLSPADRDELIVNMCMVRPLSVQELSELLGRSIDHIRKILQPLVGNGRLSYLYPNQPQHPHQRYHVNQLGRHP